MSAEAKCRSCPSYRPGLSTIAPINRQEALKYFIGLQAKDLSPCMCEHDFGEYTLCHTGHSGIEIQ